MVQEALSGLPGVQAAEADAETDLIHVRYDPKQVTHEAMLAVIDKQGFQAKVVPTTP